MIGKAAFCLLFWAVSALAVWRLYGAFTRGVMILRGGSYERATSPKRFWLSVSLAAFALVWALGIAVAMTAWIVEFPG